MQFPSILPPVRLVLSYFDSYFSPGRVAPYENHSAGQIARHLYEAMAAFGEVETIDSADRPSGRDDDLFVGHFWSFAEQVRANAFGARVVVYTMCDPGARERLVAPLEGETGLPEPAVDRPPRWFDHEETMRAADLVLLVGNSWTLQTFALRWRAKIRLLDYSVDGSVFFAGDVLPPRGEVCCPVTRCGLRKGFLDVIETWRAIDPGAARLHAIGAIDDGWSRFLAARNNGSIVHHGWIESRDARYGALLRRCRFAHLPTLAEGQMGTLLEAVFCGCIPITTRNSGIDDRLLEHCIVVEPRDVAGQRAAILDALSWSDQTYAERRRRMLGAARDLHAWPRFRDTVSAALQEAAAVRAPA